MIKKYAFAGASARALMMYAQPLVNDFSDVAKIVGVYDINYKRSEMLVHEIGIDVPVYRDFDEMVAKEKPDAVIVTTVDRFHHEYIIKSLEAGCDAITEKPMTIDAQKCNAILEAEKRTGKRVIVTFNYRFMPFITEAKRLINAGEIGKIHSVHFEWQLDRSHGADYFRRWHSDRNNSGSLFVHKATHHFDLVNWLIDQEPVKVNAFANRQFYGENGKYRSERCMTCPHKNECEFYWDITQNEFYKKFYVGAEDVDNYYRDQCVFRNEINIFDTMTANVLYSGGAMMSYSLTTNSPYEDFSICINGSKGRMVIGDVDRNRFPDPYKKIKIYDINGTQRDIKFPVENGGHGGGDSKLRDMIFRGAADPLGHCAGTRAGAMSIMTGIAAYTSVDEDRAVYINELLDMTLLGE
ncbi:MAG: Gfo/Idh/MocA family oxidoreductase [Clostridiales bacterium]|nr:Gfo/Idh/MocA family oxidoreductase [Clostridiales bacterium]